MLPASTQRAVPVAVTTLRCGGGPRPTQPHTLPAPLHAAQTKPSLIFRGKMGSVSCLGLGLALLLCFRQLSGGLGSVPRCWSAGATPPGTTWVRALSSGLPRCGHLGTHAVGQVAPGRGHRRSEGPRPRPRWQGARQERQERRRGPCCPLGLS